MLCTKSAIFLLTILIVLQKVVNTRAVLKFKDIECEILDHSFGEVQNCAINVLDRKTTTASFNIKLKKDITDGVLHVSFMKKFSEWQPFLYTLKVDGCKFLRHPNKWVLMKVLYDYLHNYTNIKHTCPYMSGAEVILDSFELNESKFLGKFPIDIGEYGVFTKLYTQNKLWLKMNLTATYSDSKKNN